jgi:hypothetical protein
MFSARMRQANFPLLHADKISEERNMMFSDTVLRVCFDLYFKM